MVFLLCNELLRGHFFQLGKTLSIILLCLFKRQGLTHFVIKFCAFSFPCFLIHFLEYCHTVFYVLALNIETLYWRFWLVGSHTRRFFSCKLLGGHFFESRNLIDMKGACYLKRRCSLCIWAKIFTFSVPIGLGHFLKLLKTSLKDFKTVLKFLRRRLIIVASNWSWLYIFSRGMLHSASYNSSQNN